LNVLVIGAHPDDEVVGMGATIKKLSKKNKIFLCIITDGTTAQYDDKKMIKVRRDVCIKSSKLLGITKVKFLDFPDMGLDTISQLEINKELEKIIEDYKPKVVYTTPAHDLHKDHQLVFDSAYNCYHTSYLDQLNNHFNQQYIKMLKKNFRTN